MLQKYRFFALMLLLLLTPVVLTATYYAVKFTPHAQSTYPRPTISFPPGFGKVIRPTKDNKSIWFDAKKYLYGLPLRIDRLPDENESPYKMTLNNNLTLEARIVASVKDRTQIFTIFQDSSIDNKYKLYLCPIPNMVDMVGVGFKLEDINYEFELPCGDTTRNRVLIPTYVYSTIKVVKTGKDIIISANYNGRESVYSNKIKIISTGLTSITAWNFSLVGFDCFHNSSECNRRYDKHIITGIDYLLIRKDGRNFVSTSPIALWNFNCNLDSAVPYMTGHYGFDPAFDPDEVIFYDEKTGGLLKNTDGKCHSIPLTGK